MRQYATEADLTAEYPDTVHPANVVRLLKVASAVVDTALSGVVYDTDPVTLLPTDVDVTEAMMVATCAIVAEWVAVAAAEAGATDALASASIGNVSLTRVQRAQSDLPRIDGFPVPSVAITMLRQVGNVSVVQP